MATRTISNTGGNYNATGTWVEGIVPTSADDVVATATSGQLTVNVSSAARSIDLTAYTNTITFNAQLNVQGASATSNIGASTSFAGTATLLFSNAHTISQNGGTNRIPVLSFATGTKTLNSDIYCAVFTTTTNVTINGNTIYSNGNFGLQTTSTIGVTEIGGTTNFILDGSGLINFYLGAAQTLTINTSGEYNTIGRGLQIGGNAIASPAPTFNFISGSTPTLFNAIIDKRVLQSSTYTVNILVPINLFINNTTSNSLYPNLTINTPSGITCNFLGTVDSPKLYTTDNVTPIINFTGGSISAQTLSLTTTYRTTSSSTNPPAAGSLTYKSISLKFDPSYTHYFDKMELTGGGIPERPFISSTTSSPASIVLGDKETSQIVNFDFYDIDASGGEQIVAINGSISGTTNITTTYPSGGGGGGGSFTFVN